MAIMHEWRVECFHLFLVFHTPCTSSRTHLHITQPSPSLQSSHTSQSSHHHHNPHITHHNPHPHHPFFPRCSFLLHHHSQWRSRSSVLAGHGTRAPAAWPLPLYDHTQAGQHSAPNLLPEGDPPPGLLPHGGQGPTVDHRSGHVSLPANFSGVCGK